MDTERIEEALRQRPSDEATYARDLRSLAEQTGPEATAESGRVRVVSRLPSAGIAGLLFAAAAVAVLVAGALLLPGRFGSPAAASPSASPAGYRPTGLVGCFGQPPGFDPAKLDGPTNAEQADTATARLLRTFLADHASDPLLPHSGWILVAQADADTAEFFARTAGGSVSVTVGHNPVTGEVGVTGYGSCELAAVPPAGYGPAAFTLDPAYPLTASATELHLLVDEMTCHGDASLAGRIATYVQYKGDSIVVNIGVRSLEGAWTCPKPPPTPYVLQLDQPLGNRSVVDGGSWPPTKVSTGTALITPTPLPTRRPGSHFATDCSGDAPGDTLVADFFKSTSMAMPFDVYCAVLPAGWRVQAKEITSAKPGFTVTYQGPNGEQLYLREQLDCPLNAVCDYPSGEPAKFGEMNAYLAQSADGPMVFAIPDGHHMWSLSGRGVTKDQLIEFAAAMILLST